MQNEDGDGDFFDMDMAIEDEANMFEEMYAAELEGEYLEPDDLEKEMVAAAEEREGVGSRAMSHAPLYSPHVGSERRYVV